MDRQLSSPSAGSTIVGVLKPFEGGTGGTTQAAALAALGGISATQVGQPNGVAQLANDGKINPDNIPADGVAMIGVSGPLSMGINSVATYEITNYDAFTPYTLTALAGSVTRFNSTITYSSAGSAGPAGFRINGRLVAVNIVGDRPSTPVLTGVTSGTSKQVTATLTSSAFQMSSGSGSHSSSDWQLAQDAKFDNVLQTSMFNAVNLTAYSFTGLSPIAPYFARVRYRDNNGNYSEWSPTITLVAPLDLKIDTEEQKIPDPGSTNSTGWNRMAMSQDGSRIIVSSFGLSSSTGSAYIFSRIGLAWTLEATLRPADSIAADTFGYWVDISDDGSRIVASAINADPNSVVNSGAVYIFLRTGTTWAQEAKLVAADKATSDQLGDRVAIDSSGTRVLATSLSGGGSAYMFTRSGTSWTQEQKITKPVEYVGSQTGFQGAAIAKTGDRLFVSYSDAQVGGVAVGSVYVFKRTGVAWTKEATLNSSSLASGGQFGLRLATNADGSTVASCSLEGTGRVYVYTRNNVTWSQTGILVGNDVVSGEGFAGTCAVSDDGKRVVVTAYQATISGFAGAGAAYIFANNGAIWSQESKVAASDSATNRRFGSFVDISGDGTRISVSTTDPSNLTANQAIYIYR